MGSQWIRVGASLLLAGAGCALGRGREASSDANPQPEWSLTVTNRHWLDVSIHVLSNGQRNRVGTVPAVGAASYDLPPSLVGPGRTVRLEASAIGSPARATSEALLVYPGQHVEWILQNGLERSSASVW